LQQQEDLNKGDKTICDEEKRKSYGEASVGLKKWR
jgi:hypothetical protein